MLLALISLQYLNQQVAYNHLDCYGDNSQISLSRDEFKFVIDLEVVNEACAVFPNSIGANLTVSSALIPDTLQLAAYNFDFLKTTRLEFQIPTHDSLGNPIDLDAYDEEFYAVLEVFSYTEITRVELTVFDDVRSDLENCFSSLQIQLDTNNFKLAVTPTKACKQQITLKSGATDTTYISQTVIKLGTFSFDIDVTQFVNKYIADVPFDFQIFPTNEEMMAILADTNLKATLSLFSQQGLSIVQLNYRISDFLIIQSTQFSYSQVYLYDKENKGFKVSFAYEDAQVLEQQLNLFTFDEVQYRLTGTIRDSVFQASKFQNTFDKDFVQIDYSCAEGSITEQQKCEQQYTDDFNAETPPVYTLSILFLNNKNLVFMLKMHLEPIYDCWKNAQSSVINNILNLQMNYNIESCPEILMQGGTLFATINGVMNQIGTKEEGYDRYEMNWTCDQLTDKCENVQKGSELIYQFEFEDYIYQIVIDQYKKTDYTKPKYTAVVIGVVANVVSFVICVDQMIHNKNKIKKVKK
ncbi:Conserved_hypothetical protein [Hexamita inflata]|uniref:Transmembrane protein n=1 Tax=Hexamita inflata TaxID=28002 RepID=A0AA86PU27_9EUKA|nr:Conserved hypothetical protein [Hexamita inflata]